MKIIPEEAIEFLSQYIENDCYTEKCQEAHRMAISIFRPVSREYVKKMWMGEWIMHDDELGLTCECSRCHIETMGNTPFCPHCGAPMTDDAVGMVMERMDALHENIYNG